MSSDSPLDIHNFLSGFALKCTIFLSGFALKRLKEEERA